MPANHTTVYSTERHLHMPLVQSGLPCMPISAEHSCGSF